MKATLEGNAFNRLFKGTRKFISRKEDFPAGSMIQLCFYKDGAYAEAYALNGYCAAEERAECEAVDEDFKTLMEVPPLYADRDAIVKIEVEDDYTYISYGDIRFRTKQPSTKPVDIKKIFQHNTKESETISFAADADYMIHAIQSLKSCGGYINEPIIVEYSTQDKPIIFRTNATNRKMVMPIRMAAKRMENEMSGSERSKI